LLQRQRPSRAVEQEVRGELRRKRVRGQLGVFLVGLEVRRDVLAVVTIGSRVELPADPAALLRRGAAGERPNCCSRLVTSVCSEGPQLLPVGIDHRAHRVRPLVHRTVHRAVVVVADGERVREPMKERQLLSACRSPSCLVRRAGRWPQGESRVICPVHRRSGMGARQQIWAFQRIGPASPGVASDKVQTAAGQMHAARPSLDNAEDRPTLTTGRQQSARLRSGYRGSQG
jgi:hypothetical protein